MSKLLPDIKYMVTRKNKSYLHSLYVGVFGGTLYLPLATWNGLVAPTIVRFKALVVMYVKYVWAGVTGYADVLTKEEYEQMNDLRVEALNRVTASLTKVTEQLEKDTDR